MNQTNQLAHTFVPRRFMIPASVFQAIVENSRTAVVVGAPDSTILFANRSAVEIFGWINEESNRLPKMVADLTDGGPETIRFCKHPEEPVFWLECELKQIEIEGRACSLLTCRDVTFEKQRELRLQKEAHTDFLSGLSNRREFHNSLESNSDRPICVGVIDVDHFKQINDQHGHLIGDAAIRFLAEQLHRSFCDALCVARLGGEEFGVIVDGSIDDVSRQFESLKTDLERCTFSEHNIRLTVSMGVAVCSDANDGYALLECADKALYESKKLGRNRLTVFEFKQV